MAESSNPRERHRSLTRRLADTSAGYRSWRKWQAAVRDVLTWCFVPPLLPPEEEGRIDRGRHRIDLIFPLSHDASGFWDYLRREYQSHALIVEVKNLSEAVSPGEFFGASKYLAPTKLGVFEVVVTRQELSPHALEQQVSLWRDDHKMLAHLMDRDLQAMADVKLGGGDPAGILWAKILQIRRGLPPARPPTRAPGQ